MSVTLSPTPPHTLWNLIWTLVKLTTSYVFFGIHLGYVLCVECVAPAALAQAVHRSGYCVLFATSSPCSLLTLTLTPSFPPVDATTLLPLREEVDDFADAFLELREDPFAMAERFSQICQSR